MQLLSARLVNVCQHVDLAVTFGPGITSIVGPNGAGKSNLIGLIRACITNDYSQMGGSKDQNIRRGKESSEPSYVETTWSTPSGTIAVRRGLAGVKSQVLLNSEIVVPEPGKAAKEKAVTEKALELLGTTSGFINNFMFANYDRLREVTDGNKSQRAALFTSLCGLDIVEKIDRNLREIANEDKARMGEFSPADLDAALLDWAQLKLNWKGASAEVKDSLRDMPSSEERLEIKEDVQWLNDLMGQQKANREARTRAKERIRKYKVQAQSLEKEFKYYEMRHKTLTDCVSKSQANVQVLSDIRKQEESRRSLVAHHKRAESEVTRLNGDKPKKEAIPEEFKDVGEPLTKDEATSCLSEQQRIISSSEAKLKLVAEGNFTCPTCDQPITYSSPEEVAKLEDALQAARRKAVVCRSHLGLHRWQESADMRYKTKSDSWKQQIKQANQSLAEAKEAVADLAEISKPQEFDLKAAKARLSRFSSALESAEALKTEFFGLLSSKKQGIASGEREIEDANKALAEFKTVTARELESAKKRADEVIQQELELASSQAALIAYSDSVDTISNQLRKMRAKRRKLKKLDEWLAVAQRARAICHRDSLPSSVVAGMLHRTTAQVNEYLLSLGVPFQVSVDAEEFAFEVTHQDGSTEPAKRLSTGQSLCLGIAFWLARASVFAGQLPFFCLDEPTANLDEERLLNVADVIGKLSTEMETNGRQGVVVTHHASIARRSTQIVTLK